MSMYAMLFFKDDYDVSTTTPASIDPSGSSVYGQNLPRSWDELNATAKKLRVTEPESFRVDEDGDEAWHPIAKGLKTFEALAKHYGEPPASGAKWKPKDGIAWDVKVFAAVLREAQAAGETE